MDPASHAGWEVATVLHHATRRAAGIVLLGLIATTATVHATPASVRVKVSLRSRDRRDPGATYIDISVRGTQTPLRLVRRVEGACTVHPITDDATTVVRVVCPSPTATGFEVGLDHGDVVVRKGSVIPDAEMPAALQGPVVISRTAAPGGARLQLE